jgi:hypothetical protein
MRLALCESSPLRLSHTQNRMCWLALVAEMLLLEVGLKEHERGPGVPAVKAGRGYEFNNAIGLEVAKALEGRAVLVFFESEARMEAWQASSYGQRLPAGTLEVIKSDTMNIDMKVRKATHSGQVTLLTREHGRGLDFLCSDKKVDG